MDPTPLEAPLVRPPVPRPRPRAATRNLTGDALRLVFVGQATYFACCALADECPWIESSFVDFRAGDDPRRMVETVRRRLPHIVIVFKPEVVPVGAFADLEAITVGYLTEPLPRRASGDHPDLERRLVDLRRLDATNFDRLISFDPLMAPTIETIAPVWRSVPLPVADRYFRPVRPVFGRSHAIFLGRSTHHRESFLLGPKHRFDITHIAHGVGADELDAIADSYDVGINLHNEPYPTFENRVAIHLAAAQLVLSEPLSPTHGLEPGLDYVQIETPTQLQRCLTEIFDVPDMYLRVRTRGRQKAEMFRASRVYPRLVADVLRDVDTFGRRNDAVSSTR